MLHASDGCWPCRRSDVASERPNLEEECATTRCERSKPEEATASGRRTASAPACSAGAVRFPDIDCSGKAVVGRLLHLHEVFLTAINRTLAKHRLKYPAFAVLATLRVEGAPYRMSPKALLDSLILTSGGLSNLLRKLEKAGHIRRMADDTDGRGVIVELTEQGRRSSSPRCAIMLRPSKGLSRHCQRKSSVSSRPHSDG